MDLKDLKKTWEKMGATNQLDENQLKEMLGKRTKSLIEKIDRNIKIGFIILFVLILIFALDDFLFSPLMIEGVSDNLEIPKWLLFLGIFSNALIFTTFVYFVIKYYRVKSGCDIACNLRETLIKIIDTLKIYQRLFYLALITLLVAMGLGFISGMYNGFLDGIEKQGVHFPEVQIDQLILAIIIGMVILLITVGGIFLLMRWGFRKLYGNYIQKLKLTLNELQEIDE